MSLFADRRRCAGRAEAKVRVVTTIETFADLARKVGGDRVEVKSLSHGYMDPHFVEPKPSLVHRSQPRRSARARRARARDRLAAAAGARLAQREDRHGPCRATSTRRRRSRCSTCRPSRSIARWATSIRRATRTIGSRPTTRVIIAREIARAARADRRRRRGARTEANLERFEERSGEAARRVGEARGRRARR